VLKRKEEDLRSSPSGVRVGREAKSRVDLISKLKKNLSFLLDWNREVRPDRLTNRGR